MHFNGRRWLTVASLPARLATPRLGTVLAQGPADVWVGGARPNSGGGSTEAVGHWDGRGWTVTTLPAAASRVHYHLTQLVPDGTGGMWAIGQCASCDPTPSRLWHEHAGRWSGPFAPRLARHRWILFGLAAAGRSVWADGAVDAAGISGLIALWGPPAPSSPPPGAGPPAGQCRRVTIRPRLREDAMAARLGNITFDCDDVLRLAGFWSAVLGRPLDQGSSKYFASIGGADPQRQEPAWYFNRVPESKQAKNRVHLDLVMPDPGALDELTRLGATVVGTHEIPGGSHSWTVLQDPEGNEFCIADKSFTGA